MKKLSLKNLNLEVSDLLQRSQLKSVFGGYSDPACGGGRTTQFTWACPDGSASGTGYTCTEYLQAYADMIEEFCS